MTENTPRVPEEMRQLNRTLTEKVLDRAASDPQWKQRLLDDPEAAMREANFPETQQLEQIEADAGEGEVRGQAAPVGDVISDGNTGDTGAWGGGGGHCPWYCYWWTYYWDRRTWY